MILEICCDTIESALNADIAGADRIEFCSDLNSGGLTPSLALVGTLKEILNIPINVLIRPRQGNFVYSDWEFKTILKDIDLFKSLNINGIVSGVLTKDGEVDIPRTKLIMQQLAPLEFTFHRAIDNTKNYFEEIEKLYNIGVKKVLTSGGHNSVDAGFDNIAYIQNKFGKEMTIMPGSAVNINNILKFKEIEIREIHSSASKKQIDNNYFNPLLAGMGNIIEEKISYNKISDIETIKNLLKTIK